MDIYIPDKTKNRALIVDIDGTVADKGNRHPFDWDKVGEDQPRHAVLELVKLYYIAGYEIIFISGRDEACRYQTELWLDYWFGGIYTLYMRPHEDYRPDTEIKAEIFDKYIRFEKYVVAVVDDRDSVVAMWRAGGLDCFQVAPGAF